MALYKQQNNRCAIAFCLLKAPPRSGEARPSAAKVKPRQYQTLNQRHIGIFAGFAHIVRPDARLGFADVSLVEQYHTEATLTYAATDSLWQSPLQKATVKV